MRLAFSRATSDLKGTYGSRSILVSNISSDLKKMEGYLRGLSSPSVVLNRTIFASSDLTSDLKGTYGSRSILVSNISSDLKKMEGYLRGLSSPSVVLNRTIFAS